MTSLNNIFKQIDDQITELSGLLPLKSEDQLRLDKKFRLEFNYNSNHLEGNTLTYGETELLLIFDKTKGDHEKREYDEMSGHDIALKMIQEEAKDTERPLTEQFIRVLNEQILVRPFWKNAKTPDGQPSRKQIIPGQYKTTPNSVELQNGEIFEYTSPADTPLKMQELVQWYNENSKKEHPLLLASLLHYRFVRIHPFDDGNGRVSRLLMNYVLLKNQLPMVVIKSDEKKAYLNALNQADTGEIDAFVNYIGEQLLWSLDLNVKAAKGENIEEPDDLDKKIAVLSKKVKADKKDIQKNSPEILIKLFQDSLYPLIDKICHNIEKFLEFYENITWQFGFNNSHYSKDFKLLKQHIHQLLTLKKTTIQNVKIQYSFKGFKADVTSGFIFSGDFELSFEEYRYYIKWAPKIEKTYPYDYRLNDKEIDQIINQIIKPLYEDTERKVEQVKNI